ncbi:AtaL-like protein [Kribbella sp. NPDC050470]|uniref:AtaL-like protein n=1 Tax=unclassified Kribbella TaxID=2644121 RepID=UPI003794BCAE
MIDVSRTLPVNDGSQPELSLDQVWEGLVDKAANPLPYVKSITECTVVDRFEGGLVRDIIHVGRPVREVVTFYPRKRVHFVRTHGIARGTIDNEIGTDSSGNLGLTFTFRIVVDGVEDGSAEETEFATQMEADYLDAVRTTLAACRERAGTASPPNGPVTTAVFKVVDSLDAKGFAEFFAPDGKITFGNNPALVGRSAVESGTADFLKTIDGIKHEIVNEWAAGNDTVVELSVTYARKDGATVTIPVVTIWTARDDGLFQDYRVYFDLAPVFG